MRIQLLMILTLLLLTGCASDQSLQGVAETDYKLAVEMIKGDDYEKATLFLQGYSATHPYSSYAIHAEILRIFSSYKGGEYTLTETLCEEFLRRHPRHKDAAYIKYILAMSHYLQVSPPEKDQGETLAAIQGFERLIRDHPGTPFADDASRRLQKLHNHLAQHEVDVGRFYFERDLFLASLNRFQEVMVNYQTTPAIEEALFYLAASYAALSHMAEARDAALLLQHNFPDSHWSDKVKRFL
ncbi:MAG: outer membrane protein assembly factor BamD [Mariprofundaceae bacterium]